MAKPNKITRILIYVALEWTLIFLLLINSLFSYLILKLALYFGLKPPCLFCSRIDHYFDSQRKSTEFICEQHATEISALGYCSNHKKLFESKIVCDDCCSGDGDDGVHLVNWMKEIGGNEVRKCSCCEKMINPRKDCIDLMANLITERELIGCFPERDLINFDQFDSGYHQVIDEVDEVDEIEEDDGKDDLGLEEEKEPLLNLNLISVDMIPQHMEFYIDHDDYRLIPVENSGNSIDFVSNNGKEIRFEEEFGNGVDDLVFDVDEVRASGNVISRKLSSILEEEDEVAAMAGMEESPLDLHEQVFSLQVDRKEIECDQSTMEEAVIECCETVECCRITENENDAEIDAEVRIEMERILEDDEIHEDSFCQVHENVDEKFPEDDEIEEGSFLQIHDNVEDKIPEDDEIEEDKIPEDDEIEEENFPQIHENVEEKFLEVDEIEEENFPQIHDNVEEKIPEVDEIEEENFHQIHENVEEKIHGVDEIEDGNSPQIHDNVEDKIHETPASVESLNVHKKFQVLGRGGSLTEESVDGSITSENEVGDGVALAEKLKSELQSERKTLRALYAELEEERSASAIAANQTMAMINRLQEEKATMQMEALQYQRMMEEQSEYDQEALQMMNELMVKREKEKQELEKEVEVYKKKLVDFEEREKIRILSRRMEGSLRSRNSSPSCSYEEESDGLSIDLNHEVVKDHEEEGSGVISLNCGEENGHQDTPSDEVLNLQHVLVGFEDERQSILEQLKVLEEKLVNLADEEDSDEEEDIKEFNDENGGENGKHHESLSIGSMQKRLLPLFDEVEEGEGFDMSEKKRLAIEEEVDHVYERLHALEADKEFLKHCIGSLKKGDKGLDLLQEILQHLRELKNVELHVMKNIDPCATI